MKIILPGVETSTVACVLVCAVIYNCYGVSAVTRGSTKIEEDKVSRSADSAAVKKVETTANVIVKGQAAINFDCKEQDKECKEDELGYHAIQTLHRLIDDDHNGNVDQSESDEFLRDELQYTDGFERHSLFHNNDKLISVDDLWRAWKFSEVYNWTVDDVIDWLQKEVDLPQYAAVFVDNTVSGPYLPRLASSSSALVSELGIKNPVHKQKLALKAMDTVLFGAPPKRHSYIKDLVLVASLIFAVGGCWFAYLHHRYSREQVRRLMIDLESLQKAEEALMDVQRKLEDAENQKVVPGLSETDFQPVCAVGESKEEGIPNYVGDGTRQIEEELAATLLALHHAENRLEQQWSPPGELQAWLQLTYEIELKHYNAKRQTAEHQFHAVKELCEKIKKRNKALFGALRMAHTNSIDDVDERILDARMALDEVKQDLQERLMRWHIMERICGFPIISNPGLAALRQTLHGAGGLAGRLPSPVTNTVSVDEADEDMPPPAGYPPLPSVMAASKSFLRKRAGTGSTGSLSHLARAGVQLNQGSHTALHNPHVSSHPSAAMLNRDNHEADIAGTAAATEPVTFHLGEQLQHAQDRLAAVTYSSHHHYTPLTSSYCSATSVTSPQQATPTSSSPTGSSAPYGGVYIGGVAERMAVIGSQQSAVNGVTAAYLHSKSLNYSDSDDNLSQATLDSLPRSLSSGVLQRIFPGGSHDLSSHTPSLDTDDRSLSRGSLKKRSTKKKILGLFRKSQKQKSV